MGMPVKGVFSKESEVGRKGDVLAPAEVLVPATHCIGPGREISLLYPPVRLCHAQSFPHKFRTSHPLWHRNLIVWDGEGRLAITMMRNGASVALDSGCGH